MAKGQLRSNKEIRKPKKSKDKPAAQPKSSFLEPAKKTK